MCKNPDFLPDRSEHVVHFVHLSAPLGIDGGMEGGEGGWEGGREGEREGGGGEE